MRFGSYASVLAFTVLGSAASSQKPALNWTSQQAETLRHFRALVQIDTSNPPGNEVRIVEYLEKVLASDGIPSTRFALDPNRPNLVARLKGNGAKRPVLMLAHTDVVGVQRDKWPVDPFGAVLRDGYVWGRGTTDDKDNLAASLMTLLLIKRSGAALDRDVIFLAESGEEADPTGVGIRFMVDRHFEAIDGGVRHCRGERRHHRGWTRSHRPDCDDREGSAACAADRDWHLRPRLRAAPRQCGDSPRERGGEDRHVGDADAPQRDHADVLREARVDQHAGAGVAIQEPARPATFRRCPALSCRARTGPLFRTPDVARADDVAGGNWSERNSFHGRSGDRHPHTARRRPPGPDRADVGSNQRPRGQDRAVADHPSCRATLPDRLSDVPVHSSRLRCESTRGRPCSPA